VTLDRLRRFAAAQSLFAPTTLARAIRRLSFVQADPIRAPARAQDLMLRHRVADYRSGDLERRYAELDVHEDYFINYGFVAGSLQALMHPRSDSAVPADSGGPWKRGQRKRAQLVHDFIRERGEVHPREVADHFSMGTEKNYWGGSSNATTRLLEAMHYRGFLRIVRREAGIRIFSVHAHGPEPANAAERSARIDALVDAAVRLYAPLPGASLSFLVRRLRSAVPQWRGELTAALTRARHRLDQANVDGVDWFWPAGAERTDRDSGDAVRLLSPFDPIVWDRSRFELLWGWAYRFEAYTPARKRRLGYYALPMVWRDRVIGWGNISVKDEELQAELGYVGLSPRDRVFKRELAAELDRVRGFLGLET
jgi:uncharacterized protein YcaQ